MSEARDAGRSRFPFASVVVGFGLGGLFDGIVLHQILQWHHLISTKLPPDDLAALQANTLADGIFHQVMWVIVVVGVVLLVRDRPTIARPAFRDLTAGVLIGFGLFNLVDEAVFHVALDLHHIRPGPDVVFWDLAFTGWGIAMILLGLWLLRRAADSALSR